MRIYPYSSHGELNFVVEAESDADFALLTMKWVPLLALVEHDLKVERNNLEADWPREFYRLKR